MVYEKHYWRAGNRLTLTVTIDNMSGRTRVHTVGGGGGEGLFRFDWGASQSFEGVVQDALAPYLRGGRRASQFLKRVEIDNDANFPHPTRGGVGQPLPPGPRMV